ncbi:MAG: hypothetical protein RLZZ293_65 [Pseudomonadota bacterium]|jgi:hypothetical protein
MRKLQLSKLFISLTLLPLGYCYANESAPLTTEANQFQKFDNNVTINYDYATIENTARYSTIGLSVVTLLNNNIWLNANAAALLSYELGNNNQGLSNMYQNKSGSMLELKGGYSFAWDNINLIPYLGFNYTNLLVAYNQDSSQQFIFENPSYSPMIGLNTEYIFIPQVLKGGLDTSLAYSVHKAVLPNTPNTLGHIDYHNYNFNLTPSLQYNINSRFTMIGYYSFTRQFSGSANPPSVEYPEINVNSANVINNNQTINAFGIKFGLLF